MPDFLRHLTASAGSVLPLPRLLLVFAHPDDEVLAIGARMERLGSSRLLTVTDGAPLNGNDARHHGFATLAAYRQARREELSCALRHAGLPDEGAPVFPDAVPDQTASLHLVPLVKAVASLLQSCKPEAILTHPYEGGHPDHDACAFVVHTAVRLLLLQNRNTVPIPIMEAPFYHMGETGSMRTGAFLPSSSDSDSPILTCPLSPEERERKQERLACFRSQAETLAQFPLQSESFRVAPRYDFTAAPHTGELLYERFGWGMQGERFRALAASALREILPDLRPEQEVV